MKRLLKWIGLAVVGLTVIAGIAYAATPGYHRALTPTAFGLQKVAPNLTIDDPSRTAEMQGLIAEAEDVTRAFFKNLNADPIYVVCTTKVCSDAFNLRPRGLSLGYQLILIAPHGIDPMIFAHERIHAELHRFMGWRDLVDQRFPAWFDEGLASHISDDLRLNRPADPRNADFIKTARSFRDWGRHTREHGWQNSYGAAARLVQEIEAQIGRDGLLSLIHQVADGAEFEQTLTQMVKG